MLNLKVYQKYTHEEQLIQFSEFIGKQVCKRSNKPFKSGEKINTIRGIVQHIQTPNLAFTFEEDDSSVECCRCVVLF
jgi:hypothetical protein